MSSDPASKYETELEEKHRSPSPEELPNASDRKDVKAGPRDPRSRDKYNPISRIFFFWLETLFCLGCRRDLTQADLYAHPGEADSEALHKKFCRYWNQELQRKNFGKKPRLWMVITKSFIWLFILQGVLAVVEVTMLLGQSLLLGELVDYFFDVGRNQTITDCFMGIDIGISFSVRNAYLYALGLMLLAMCVAVVHAHYALIGSKIGMMARIMTTNAVYEKILCMSHTTINKLTTGHLINVVSNDVQRFDLAFLFLPYLWIAPLYMVVFTYLVYQEVGWVVFVTLFFFVLQIPVQLVFAKIFTGFRFKSAKETDKRIRIMNEVITGIRVIKMYAWEDAFEKLITLIRKNEARLIKIGGLIRTLIAGFNFGVALNLYMAITFLVYVGTGGELNPRRVIITLSLLGFLRNISASFLIRCVFLLFEARVGFTRVQAILDEEEIGDEVGVAIKKGMEKAASSKGDMFRQSPWLSDNRKVVRGEDVELTSLKLAPPASSPTLKILTPPSRSVTPSDGDGGGGREEGLESPHEVVLPALQSYIKVQDLSASWDNDLDNLTLKKISFELNMQKPFMAVVGKVGCGKSSLLQCLLRELKALEGTVDISGNVSYMAQTPWVFSGTVRDNILFGLTYNKEKYDKITDACALTVDFMELSHGDLTLVGERGVTLSGGQKARVNLARAVYREAKIYLLDDPFSAVDASVAREIWEKCIRKHLLLSQVILVTHQVQFAIEADQLLVLNNDGGMMLCKTGEELLLEGIDRHGLLKILKEKGEEYVYDDVPDDDEEDMGLEDSFCLASLPPTSLHHGSVTDLAYRRILNRGDSIVARRATGLEESITSVGRQRYTSLNRGNNLLGSVVEGQSHIVDDASLYSSSNTLHAAKEETDSPQEGGVAEEKARGTISFKTYFNFFRAGASYVVLFIVFAMFILGEATVVISDSWLSEWSSCAVITNFSIIEACDRRIESICYLTEGQRMGIYGGITLASIILNFVRSALFYLVCVNASRVLHNRMFRAIIKVPIRFFDTNPSGRVLNRFSKDIGFLDDLLPHTFLEYLFLLVRFLAVLITAAYGNYYVLIPAALILIGFILIRWYFLKTSRDIKRLEAVARSPVYSHFSVTIQGLSTIRSQGMVGVFKQLLHTFQNQHTQGWYLYLVSSRWFGLRIDLISALYLGAVAFISVPLAEQLDAGVIGLGLAYTIALAGVLQFCVRQSAEVENIMISTERIVGYSRLEPEALDRVDEHVLPPEDSWPEKGEIKLEHVKFRYAPELPYVIEGLNFLVRSSEKVGIVGRTGAGKSSLISVLFRLAEPEGSIRIDGFNTRAVKLQLIRKKISIIPQDPVLFSGSVRYNLDPCDDYADADLWTALDQVQLKTMVQQMPAQLSEEVAEGGSNFSVGEKQLVCLARALLKKNKILILDEATANVDPGTDEIIQKTIRNGFKECTVLTIAHRLNTIMDSDRIMVMHEGKVKEFDSPYTLLQNEESLLYKMVKKTGPEASKELHQMAQKHINNLKNNDV